MFKNSNISDKQVIETGIVFSFISILSFIIWKFNAGLWIGITILFISLALPFLLKPIAILWFGLAKVLSFITSRLILCVIFIFLVTPVGLFRRLIGKDSLQLKAFKKNKESAFVDRNHEFNSADLKYPF